MAERSNRAAIAASLGMVLLAVSLAALGSAATGDTRTDIERVARSLRLGQIYPSGRLYLEGFRGEGWVPAATATDRIVYVPLDVDRGLERRGGKRSGEARYIGQADHINPPAREGMLAPDSPCVPASYEPAPGSAYVPRDAGAEPGVSWTGEDYFATDEWMGCGSDVGIELYETSRPPARSFRVLAFPPGLQIGELDYSVAGAPRPMTPAEAEAVRDRRAAEAECTLRLRDVDEARQLVAFSVGGAEYHVRISSHVSACTSLGEVFLLDVVSGTDVVRTLRTVRWRGNP